MSVGKLPIARRVLITNFVLDHGTGTEAYVRDVALRLMQLDRLPVVYTPRVGQFARRLTGDGVPVVDDLSKLSIVPDVIHGHHSLETAAAATRFPNVPVISFCHDAAAWHDTPLHLPNVVHYVGVDLACYDRLVIQGDISPGSVSLIPNGVNLNEFPLRTRYAATPKSILCFGNDFSQHHLQIVRESSPGCRVAGLGLGTNQFTSDPGKHLTRFDIVLARGRCAREAIASGAATIAAGTDAVAAMVTPDNYGFLERNNFGRRVLTKAFTAENLREEIERYDAAATREVTLRHRHQNSLEDIVQQLIDLYDREVLRFSASAKPVVESSPAVSELLAWASVHANVIQSAPPSDQTQAVRTTTKERTDDRTSPTVPFTKPKRSVPERIVRECRRVVRRALKAASVF